MTNTIRCLLALLAIPAVLICTLASCTPAGRPLIQTPALHGPTLVAAALTEVACADLAERDSDQWWECVEQVETIRCQAEGWCE